MNILFIIFLAKNEDKEMIRVTLARNVYIVCENKDCIFVAQAEVL